MMSLGRFQNSRFIIGLYEEVRRGKLPLVTEITPNFLMPTQDFLSYLNTASVMTVTALQQVMDDNHVQGRLVFELLKEN